MGERMLWRRQSIIAVFDRNLNSVTPSTSVFIVCHKGMAAGTVQAPMVLSQRSVQRTLFEGDHSGFPWYQAGLGTTSLTSRRQSFVFQG